MKRILANLLLICLGALVAIAAGEIVARIYLGYQNKALREKNQGNILTRPPLFGELFEPAQPVGFVNRPNFYADWSGVEVRTDSLGCRTGRAAPEDAPVILFIGDSMIFGLGLADSMTIPSLLQRCLQEFNPPAPARVVNAGVPGHDFQQYLMQIQRLAPLLKPSLILVGIANNDLFPTEDPFQNVLASRGKAAQRVEAEASTSGRGLRILSSGKNKLLKGSALYQIWRQFLSRLKFLTLSRKEYDPLLAESDKGSAATVDQFIQVLAQIGTPCGFVYLPEHQNLGRPSEYAYVNLLRSRNQLLLDLSLAPGLSEESYFYKVAVMSAGAIQPQMHFNAKGSRIVAQEIAEWVVEKGLWK